MGSRSARRRSGSTIPVVQGVQWAPAYIASSLAPGLLQALLVRAVAVGAQRLPVGPIPEQGHVTAMRMDVVDDGGWLAQARLLAPNTERVLA